MIAQILIEDGPSWAPYAVAIGTCATAIIALVTAIVAVTSIKQNHGDAIRKHRLESDNARQTRAHNYLERYNAREQIEPRVSLYDFFVIDKDQVEDRISEWENTSYQTKLTLAQGLNFWEELSGMYNRELVDQEIVDDYFGPEAIFIWKRVAWFVKYQREEDPDSMIEMQQMYEQIRLKRHEEGKPIDAVLQVI